MPPDEQDEFDFWFDADTHERVHLGEINSQVAALVAVRASSLDEAIELLNESGWDE
jgi:hypothetical protein